MLAEAHAPAIQIITETDWLNKQPFLMNHRLQLKEEPGLDARLIVLS